MRCASVGLALLALIAGCAARDDGSATPASDSNVGARQPLNVTWAAPVDLHGVGYEPSLAVDAANTLYLTAHKVLDRPETWPYLASWFLVSRDQGRTWTAPAAPGGLPVNLAQQFVGDEGDIGVDARGWVYFVDTYAADDHLHAWSDRAQTWESSNPLPKTAGADDRPWIAAQGEGTLHYLGNNGNDAGTGSRVWYYRSTDAGTTWSEPTFVPGNGWASLSADHSPGGKDVYILREADTTQLAGAPGDISLAASHDGGSTWEKEVAVGKRAGYGREGPVVAAAPNGTVWALWMDCGTEANCADTGGQNPNALFAARSVDAGRTWRSWNLTLPAPMFVDYPTISAGPNGTVGIAFYATTDLPVADSSAWKLYAGMDRLGNATDEPMFNFTTAAPETVYTGKDLHALHDFFEVAVGPDEHLNIAYMHSQDSPDAPVHDYGARSLWFVRGAPER